MGLAASPRPGGPPSSAPGTGGATRGERDPGNRTLYFLMLRRILGGRKNRSAPGPAGGRPLVVVGPLVAAVLGDAVSNQVELVGARHGISSQPGAGCFGAAPSRAGARPRERKCR